MNTAIAKNIKVVLFILASLSMLAILYALVFRVDFSGANAFKVQFDYVGTIMVGSPVRKSGVKIGSVSRIEINQVDQKTVYVHLSLYAGQTVRGEDRVGIVSGGILGDQFIEIFPGEVSSQIIPPGSLIIGEPALDLRGLTVQGEAILGDIGASSRILNRLLARSEEPISKIITNLETITANVAKITTDARDVGSLIPTFSQELRRTSDTLNGGMEILLGKANALLSKVEKDWGTSSGDVQAGIRNFRDLSQEIKDLMTGFGKSDNILTLLQSKDFAEKINLTLKSLQSSSDNLQKITETLRDTLGP